VHGTSFVVLSILFALTIASSSARADVVSPPPMGCARGLRPETSHGGPFCALDLCTASACSDGRSCVARSYCVVSRTGYAMGGPFIDETATDECTTDADCGGVGTCRPAQVCLDVEGFRLRGIIFFTIGLVMLGVVAWLAILSARSRRRSGG
jgi:hypothetical protein